MSSQEELSQTARSGEFRVLGGERRFSHLLVLRNGFKEGDETCILGWGVLERNAVAGGGWGAVALTGLIL